MTALTNLVETDGAFSSINSGFSAVSDEVKT